MARLIFAFLSAAFVAFDATAQAPAAKPSKAASALQAADRSAADLWLDLAAFAADRGAKTAADEALTKARALAPTDRRLGPLAKKIAALKTDAAVPAVEVKSGEIKKRLAALGDKLPLVVGTSEEAAALDARFLEGFALDPADEKRRALLAQYAADAVKSNQFARAARYAAAAADHDAAGLAAGKYAAAEDSVAREDCLLLRIPGSEFRAYVSLPKVWTPQKKWPVLVAVEGAGSNFLGAARNFRGARKDLPYIVVVPCTLSNTNALSAATYPFYSAATLAAHAEQASRFAFDADGLQGVLTVVQERFKGEARFHMTGFSGGGLLTYWWLLRRPEELASAVLAGANFHQALASETPLREGRRADVHLIVGATDEHREKVLGKYTPGIDGQTDLAQAALESADYKSIRRSLLLGVGHSPCAAEVFTFCEGARLVK